MSSPLNHWSTGSHEGAEAPSAVLAAAVLRGEERPWLFHPAWAALMGSEKRCTFSDRSGTDTFTVVLACNEPSEGLFPLVVRHESSFEAMPPRLELWDPASNMFWTVGHVAEAMTLLRDMDCPRLTRGASVSGRFLMTGDRNIVREMRAAEAGVDPEAPEAQRFSNAEADGYEVARGKAWSRLAARARQRSDVRAKPFEALSSEEQQVLLAELETKYLLAGTEYTKFLAKMAVRGVGGASQPTAV